MYIESENFVARDLKADDKEHIKMLEESRPWAKGMLKFQDTISDGEQFDYFGKLWSEYMKSEHFWCIYKKDGTFCGDVQLDKDSETEYHLYIQLMDDAPIEGFGTEMFEQLIEKIVEESGAKHLEFELWNEKDRSKIIFQEAGYDMTSGVWEYDCQKWNDKTHKIVGVDNESLFQIMDALANAISDSCEPQIIPDIEPQTVDEKTVIVVTVEAGKP